MTAPFREKQLPRCNSVPAALRHLCGNLRFAHPQNWGILNPPLNIFAANRREFEFDLNNLPRECASAAA